MRRRWVICINNQQRNTKGRARGQINRAQRGGNARCRQCDRLFTSPQALAQHRNAMHSAPTRQRRVEVPVVTGKIPGAMTFGNTPNMAIHNSLTQMTLGNTETGSKWALRALHPCDDTATGSCGIPDLTAPQAANIEIRHNAILSKATGGNGNWDCELVVLPFVDSAVAYRQRLSSTSQWGWWRIVSVSQGQVLPGLMNPAVFNDGAFRQDASVPRLPTLIAETTGFRQPYKGITVVLNANSIENQGIVTGGQWNSPVRFENHAPEISDTGHEPMSWQPLSHAFLDDIPVEPDEIVIKCAEAGQWEARKGCYMPMRFNQPVHSYSPAEGTMLSHTDIGEPDNKSFPTGFPIVLRDSTDSKTDWVYDVGAGFVWSVPPNSPPSRGTVVTTAGEINQNLGVIIFSGLSENASLVIKTRTGCELQPVEDSLLVSAVSDAPPKDPSALDIVQLTQQKLPIIYEHRYNSSGLLMGAIGGVIRTVIPLVMPWLKRVFGRKPAPSPTRPVEIELD